MNPSILPFSYTLGKIMPDVPEHDVSIISAFNTSIEAQIITTFTSLIQAFAQPRLMREKKRLGKIFKFSNREYF